MLDAIGFQQPQHAINIGCPSHIHRIFGQFIHGSEIACEPVSVGEISLPYTFFLLNGDMELNKNRQIFVNKML